MLEFSCTFYSQYTHYTFYSQMSHTIALALTEVVDNYQWRMTSDRATIGHNLLYRTGKCLENPSKLTKS